MTRGGAFEADGDIDDGRPPSSAVFRPFKLPTSKRPLREAACLCDGSRMATVHLTPHLYSFFPQLAGKEIAVEASTVSEVVRALESTAPGIGFYICDERGRLRAHVNVFVDKQMIRDRRGLSDPVEAGSEVHILQALSGG